MTTAIADTNLFLRAFVAGHEHHTKAKAIFERVKGGQLRLIWTSVIFVEVIHALKIPRFYNLDRQEIADLISPLLKLSGLRLEEPAIAERALSIFAKGKIDIADAWIAAKAQLGKTKAVCSFDHDFKNIAGLVWMNAAA